MTLSQSAVSDLLEGFRAGDGVNLIRDAVQLVLQEMIETEALEHIGADRYERSEDRLTELNGHRPRLFATQAGDVELRIPKLRIAKAAQAVMACGEKFAYVDILQNPEIRANLPKYANWPTFPQLWVGGELVGGSDIMTEMAADGSLQSHDQGGCRSGCCQQVRSLIRVL